MWKAGDIITLKIDLREDKHEITFYLNDVEIKSLHPEEQWSSPQKLERDVPYYIFFAAEVNTPVAFDNGQVMQYQGLRYTDSEYQLFVDMDYDVDINKQWYWLNDDNGCYKWIPYRQIDIYKLNQAWNENDKSCVIMDGKYRVDFDYSNMVIPTGNQYNLKLQNPGSRTVICHVPSDEIHGIPCATQPL